MLGLLPFLGLNLAFWALLGILRFISERGRGKKVLQEHYATDIFSALFYVALPFAFLGTILFTGFFSIVDSYVVPLSSWWFDIREISLVYSFGTLMAGLVGYGVVRIERTFPFLSAVVACVTLWYTIAIFLGFMDRELIETTRNAMILVPFLLAIYAGGGIGVSAAWWTEEWMRRKRVRREEEETHRLHILPSEVAAITPAHNEERTIHRTLGSLLKVLPPQNIYVGSDASTDRTVGIANSYGVNVADIWPNKGKANVLTYLIEEYQLCNRYKAVMIVDADSEISPDYLEKALPLLSEDGVAVVAVHALSKWTPHWWPTRSQFFAAYRIRFYRVLQAVFRYGQTWKYINATTIAPGFASIYRTTALRHIPINTKGLVIEDFNMSFCVHHQRLGRIAYSPQVSSHTQDPIRFKDYWKQVKRWNLGFWQTVRIHGPFLSPFYIFLVLFLVELLFFGLAFLLLPFTIALALVFPEFVSTHMPWLTVSHSAIFAGLVVLFILDYLMTVIVAWYERKPVMLLYGFLFLPIRYMDNLLFVWTIPLAFTTKSDGRWVSPTRAGETPIVLPVQKTRGMQ